MKLVVANALALVLVLVVSHVAITVGSPLPGLGGMPDFASMGHAFGAKIGNIIKGNTYDQYERVMKKLPQYRHKHSSESSADSDGDSGESPMFGFSGKQFEQLLAMLQQSKQDGQGGQPTGMGDPIPFAAIDNSVD
uniref:Secreted protein n=1 Tax=Anopheles maculatus TaxID=74869 RepID=A0A182SNL4_9DIPT